MNNQTNGILAWHFADTQQRDGTPLAAPGEVETYDGDLVMCESGLHASEKILDALFYAPGHLLRRVRVSGEILIGDDKLCASRREVLWECEMAPALRLFARKCALDVEHFWDMPSITREYLMTGRDDIRAAAGAATWASPRAAAGAAARAAAGAATWNSPRAAARAAVRAAVRAATWASPRAEQELRLVAYAQASRAGLFFGND